MWSLKLEFSNSNTVNSLVDLHAYKQSHTRARTSPFGLYFILHTPFFWFACKNRQCRCCCVCLCVLPWVAYTVYTQHKADALQHVSFCQDKQSSDTKWATCVYSPLPKVCQNECFSCQQMMETMFGDIWGYWEGLEQCNPHAKKIYYDTKSYIQDVGAAKVFL